MPFIYFFSSFINKALTLVIYDNACHLQIYYLKREPHFFQNTLFRVDRFHWSNHTACASGLNLAVYAHLRHINSQIADQVAKPVIIHIRGLIHVSHDCILDRIKQKKVEGSFEVVSFFLVCCLFCFACFCFIRLLSLLYKD